MKLAITARLGQWWRHFNSSALTARLLGALPVEDVSDPGNYVRGLVLIQIDGLSRSVFEQTLASGKMPTLARLMKREGYRLHTLYSGLPSSTPSVQAELFYGVRTAVPAFAWRERETGRLRRMYQQASAADVESSLVSRNGGQPGLLAGGSAWCNIYTGGAAEAHFCAASLEPISMLRLAKPRVRLIAVMLHLPTLLGSLAAGLLEAVRGLIDAVRGIAAGFNARAELKFIGARVGAGIWLRDLITIGTMVDMQRGLPIVHLNYIGYDEHAHRRGPDSAFAKATLPGIDRRIGSLIKACQRSHARHYDLWVFSDHGQQSAVAYDVLTGRSLNEALYEAVRASCIGTDDQATNTTPDKPAGRTGYASNLAQMAAVGVRIAAMGPVGHVYFNDRNCLNAAHLECIARYLVNRLAVPAVLCPSPDGEVRAICPGGDTALPNSVIKLLGADHPALAEIADDLIALARHDNSGDLVLLGWAAGATSVSFAIENGAHGGAGPEETRAFALMPGDLEKPAHNAARARFTGRKPVDRPWRPDDLRRAALQVLGREPPSDSKRRRLGRSVSLGPVGETRLRVMSYNVHGCVGTDGRLSPERIARVIARQAPDVVALQELDVGRDRSHRHDQVATIARLLEHQHRFHAVMQVEEGAYGDAILTHLPIRAHREGLLAGTPRWQKGEPRGVIWVTLDCGGTPLHVFNTHLGLYARERSRQVSALLSSRWLGHAECTGAVVFCGDLNTLPGAAVMRRLGKRLVDAQTLRNGVSPLSTFPSRLPFLRIDHVLLRGIDNVAQVRVPDTALERVASDHLPLVVDLVMTSVSS